MGDSKFGKPPGYKIFGRRPDQTPSAVILDGDTKGAKGRSVSDRRTHFNAGDPIFGQGDPGGDLFFIEEGTIEIFTQRESETIVLSEMGPGEIVGVMTCLTSEPRMAGARAKTRVTCKKVPHASIRKVVEALPNWMKIVLKEFTIRLTQMNKTYSDAALRIKRLEATQVTQVYTGAQLAAAFGAIAEYMAIRGDDGKIVVVEDVLAKLEAVLNLTKDEIDRVFAVLLEAGLLRLEIEPEKKRSVAKLDSALKLGYFAQFVRESKHGATKKLVRAKFSHKETRVLSAIVRFAAKLDMDLEKNCKLSVKELERSLERVTGVKFERAALDKGLDLKLLVLQGSQDDEVILMKPSHLGRTVACVEAVRKLTALDLSVRGRNEAA